MGKKQRIGGKKKDKSNKITINERISKRNKKFDIKHAKGNNRKQQQQQEHMEQIQNEQHLFQTNKTNRKNIKKNSQAKIPIKRARSRNFCKGKCNKHNFIFKRIQNQTKSSDLSQYEEQIKIKVNFCKRITKQTNQLPVIPNLKLRRNINLPLFIGQKDVKNNQFLSLFQNCLIQQQINQHQQGKQIQLLNNITPFPRHYPHKCHHCNVQIYSKIGYQRHVKSSQHAQKWNNSDQLQEIKKIVRKFQVRQIKNKKKMQKKPKNRRKIKRNKRVSKNNYK